MRIRLLAGLVVSVLLLSCHRALVPHSTIQVAVAPLAAPDCGPDTACLGGLVTDLKEVPLEGAFLLLVGDSTLVTSDASGHFRPRRLRPGTYRLWVRHVCYGPVRLDSLNLPPGQLVTVRVKLDPVLCEADRAIY